MKRMKSLIKYILVLAVFTLQTRAFCEVKLDTTISLISLPSQYNLTDSEFESIHKMNLRGGWYFESVSNRDDLQARTLAHFLTKNPCYQEVYNKLFDLMSESEELGKLGKGGTVNLKIDFFDRFDTVFNPGAYHYNYNVPFYTTTGVDVFIRFTDKNYGGASSQDKISEIKIANNPSCKKAVKTIENVITQNVSQILIKISKQNQSNELEAQNYNRLGHGERGTYHGLKL